MTEKNKEEMKDSKEVTAEQAVDSKEVVEKEPAKEVVEQKEAAPKEEPKVEILDNPSRKTESKWSKFTSNKWYVGIAALALLAAGGVAGAGATGALVYKHQTEAVGFMNEVRSRFDDDYEGRGDGWGGDFDQADQQDSFDDRDDRADLQDFSNLTTKIDFKTATETALKEAGAGFVTSIQLDSQNGKAVYEVETFDGNTEKDYTIDADSGAVLRSQTDNNLDAEDKNLPQPKKSVTDILAAAQAKYKNAKISDISLDQDRSGKWIYEVDFLDGNSFKTATFDTDNGNFISEASDRD